MRFIRPSFFAKCFLIGAISRIIVFGIGLMRQRLFPGIELSNVRPQSGASFNFAPEDSPAYVTPDFGERTLENYHLPLYHIGDKVNLSHNSISFSNECTMGTCFNFSRCSGESFKVHIYPTAVLESLLTAANDSSSISAYTKILSSIVHSGYYTSDPSQACLFVVAFDTLDRDLLSNDYVKNLQSKFASLPRSVWNNGENHLIFNLYQGTWPDYDVTDLGIDTGKAILVKASFSVTHFRPAFDISFPLFHRVLPTSTTDQDDGLFKPVVSTERYGNDARRRRYLFSFKGKRYVHGIGSETRNSLYHLHDGGRESVVVTTCRHGKNWRQVKDDRCDEDNESYDRWGTYEWLLSQADFCLVPRGRRLGSYRFLESLQYGCAPTVLANDWELPFSEIVTWSEAVLIADERLLSVLPDALHSITPDRTFKLRANAKRLSMMYFSSVERIVTTTLEIVRRRLRPWSPSPLDNNFDGSYITVSSTVPLFHAYIILATRRTPVSAKRLVDAVAASAFCARITIFCFDCAIAKGEWPVPVDVVRLAATDPLPLLPAPDEGDGKADAVYWINALTPIHFSTDEIDFSMRVWLWFPDRLVGFFSRRLHRDGSFSSKLLNDFTFLDGAAILYHKSFNQDLNIMLHSVPTEKRLACFDRLLNELAAQKGKTPIKLTARYQTGKSSEERISSSDCFANDWNHSGRAVPSSKVRFDPLLYKDPVSNLRKKYRQMELNNIN